MIDSVKQMPRLYSMAGWLDWRSWFSGPRVTVTDPEEFTIDGFPAVIIRITAKDDDTINSETAIMGLIVPSGGVMVTTSANEAQRPAETSGIIQSFRVISAE